MTTRYKEPSDLLRDIMLAYPKASEREHFEHFLDGLQNSPLCDDVMRKFWFAKHYGCYEVVQPAPHSTTVRLRDRLERKQKRRAKVEHIKEAVRSAITMSFKMPNGVELRRCTIEYVELEGGKISALARTARMRGGAANQVIGKYVTDADLDKMQGRKAA